jgi:colanic acid/amylovoran biosynthesis protein
MEKYILITGGQMYNKGAEAMVYLAVDQLKRKYPKSKIIVLSSQDYKRSKEEKSNYNFEILPRDSHMMIALSKGKLSLTDYIKYMKVILKKKKPYLKEMKRLQEIFENTQMIVDISGFALSSQFSTQHAKSYLARIDIAKAYNIPVYIMPQSFGPFDFKSDNKSILEKIKSNLSYADVVFAREKEGFELLRDQFKLSDNLHFSMDSVLVNKEVNLNNVFKTKPVIKKFEDIYGVAIIPNMKTFKHGSKNEILQSYKSIIDTLLSSNEKVYIVRHSFEDLEACEAIKELYTDEESVVLINDDLSSMEFDELVKQFKYIIGSRFHSIVHAYKNAVPSIALGWATKYKELLEKFDQQEYLFDVRSSLDNDSIVEKVVKLNDQYKNESRRIAEVLETVQSNNPYDYIK